MTINGKLTEDGEEKPEKSKKGGKSDDDNEDLSDGAVEELDKSMNFIDEQVGDDFRVIGIDTKMFRNVDNGDCYIT